MISVIVPVYNVEKYLRECLDSIINQTYRNIEVILVDDGSTDSCPKICDEYAIKDSRVQVIHKKNGGLSSARNAGIDKSKGDYIIFIDSDDYWKDDFFLEKIITKCEENNLDCLLFSSIHLVNGKFSKPFFSVDLSNIAEEERVNFLLKTDKFIAAAPLRIIKASIIKENKLYFEENIVSEDIEWVIKSIFYINKIDSIPYSGYVIRSREGSITHTMKDKNMLDLAHVIKNCIQDINNAKIDKKLKNNLLGYVNYQYIILVCLSSMYISKQNKKLFFAQLKEMKFLINYGISKKTKLPNLLIRIFGIRITQIILKFYIKIREKKRG